MASQFPKMGEEPLVGNIVNVSGARSPYTKSVPRKGPAGDSESEPATHRGVGANATGENAGPTFRPVTTLYAQNAAAASDVGRGMRTVPSSIGNRDFWNQRASQSGEVIR